MPAPAAEIEVDAGLVRALLREQHPDLAVLPLSRGPEGWDNVQWRLGDDFVVRLPRRALASRTLQSEIRWLPRLPPLPLSIPRPIRVGEPGCGYPWPRLVAPWLPGSSAASVMGGTWDATSSAEDLGRFLGALHRAAPAGLPVNPFRGVALGDRAGRFDELVVGLGIGPGHPVRSVWRRALSAAAWDGPPMWVHGDLHPHNLLVDRGRLSAVIDFGDLGAGDPAVDLASGWLLLEPADRERLWNAYAAAAGHAVDDGLRDRARGWAVLFVLTLQTHVGEDPGWAGVIAHAWRQLDTVR
ncbi:aminoglycoside phosphotransferase family protein [Nocardioidaceae bacterium]|nr:aminoglycoside phosphotransferase family protein [Nocardioidaceae bacterium]